MKNTAVKFYIFKQKSNEYCVLQFDSYSGYSDISNFSLSLLLYLAIGFTWILQGVRFAKIILLGIVIIAANVICETIMGFMNTPDIIDAVYGIAGTIISFCFLAVSRRYGLKIISELI